VLTAEAKRKAVFVGWRPIEYSVEGMGFAFDSVHKAVAVLPCSDDAAAQEQESAVRSSKVAQGMSLIDLVATPDDLKSVHKTGKTADQGMEQEDQHPAEQLDADHTRDNRPTL